MAQYKEGTVSVTTGSATVTGVGTSWLSNVSPENYFVLSSENLAYQVSAVNSDTQLTLTAPYGGATASGVGYVIHIGFFPNGVPQADKTDADFSAVFNRWGSTSIPSAFGTAASANTGTAPSEVPLNSDLGTAATANITTGPADRTGVKRAEDENVLSRDSVADIAGLTNLYDGQTVILTGWHAGSTVGGGTFTVDLTKLKSEHNGGTILSLTMPFSNTADYLNGVGETDPAGAGCLVRVNISGYVEEFGAKGDATSNADGTNDYDSFVKCAETTGICKIRAAKYNYTDAGTVHRLTKSLVVIGSAPASFNAPLSDSIIYVNSPRPPFYMSGVPSVEFKNFAMICNKNGPWTDPYSSNQATMGGVDFRCSGVHIRGNIDSTAGADTAIGTDQLLTSGAVFESAKTIQDFSPYKTFENVAGLHGVGLILSKSLDNSFRDSFISGFGVGFANMYNDLMNIDGCRITSNGINVYDRNDNPSAWGRLLKLKNSETLYNLRAPNILLDGSRYVEIDHDYYEVSAYPSSAVFIASQNSNFKYEDGQVDGLTDHAVPFMLIDSYTEGNIVKDNYFAQYTASPKSAPPIRFINTGTGNLHKREGFVIGTQKTTIFPSADFSDVTNANHIVNFRDKNLRQDILTPTNVFSGAGVEHSASVIGGKLSFSDGVTTGKFFSASMPLNRFTGTLTFNILGRSTAGGSIFFTIRAVSNTGKIVQTIRNANIFGFTDAAWVVNSSFTYNLDAVDMSAATDLSITFPTDDGAIAAIWLS